MGNSDKNIVSSVLSLFNVGFSNHNLSKHYQSNPNNQNFFGISQLLKMYGLKTIAHKTDFENAHNLTRPYIVKLTKPSELIIIKATSEASVEGIDEKGLQFKYPISSAKDRWSGYVMEIDGSHKKDEKDLLKNKMKGFVMDKMELIVFSLLIIGFVLMLYKNGDYIFSILLFLVNLGGLFISNEIANLKKSDDESQLCNVIKNSDCKSISKNTKFLNLFEYDEIGIAYFLFFCSIPLFSTYSTAGGLLFLISSVGVLFPLYSVYYQKFVAKKWCTLCLLVQVCLIINFITLFIKRHDFNYDVANAIQFVFPIIILGLITISYFNMSESKIENKSLLHRMNKFVGNDAVFNFLLESNPSHYGIADSNSIIIGGKKDREIILVTNPFCKYCVESHHVANELLKYNNNYNLKIIHLAGDNETAQSICKQLISIYFLKGETAYLEAVKDWYDWGNMNYKKWQLAYKVEEYSRASLILEENKEWSLSTKITATPTILVDNKLIPNEYKLVDLKYF